MLILGILLIVAAAIWLCFKLYVAYSSVGATDGLVAFYDGAVYPPIMIAVGLFLTLRQLEVGWPWWAYVLVWIGGAAAAVGLMKLLVELGDKEL